MKKLLATLLVAMMIMSCMTVVSFAAAEISSYSTMLGDEFYEYTEDDGFLSPAFYAYGAYVEGANNLSSKNKKSTYANSGKDPLYTYVYGEDAEADRVVSVDAASQGYVFMPIYSTEALVGINLDFTYDASKLTFASFESDFMADFNDKSTGANGLTSVGVAQEPEELVGVAFFTVNAEGVGDASGNATVAITATITAGKDLNDNTLAGSMVMTANLTGLTAGEDEGDDYIAADEIAAPLAVTGTYAEYMAEKATLEIVSGDGNEMKEGMVYTAMFATVEGSAEYAEYGIALKSSGEYLHYAAMTTGDKFGILLYGENDLMANYNACTYVKYADGTVVYGSNVTAVR